MNHLFIWALKEFKEIAVKEQHTAGRKSTNLIWHNFDDFKHLSIGRLRPGRLISAMIITEGFGPLQLQQYYFIDKTRMIPWGYDHCSQWAVRARMPLTAASCKHQQQPRRVLIAWWCCMLRGRAAARAALCGSRPCGPRRQPRGFAAREPQGV